MEAQAILHTRYGPVSWSIRYNIQGAFSVLSFRKVFYMTAFENSCMSSSKNKDLQALLAAQ